MTEPRCTRCGRRGGNCLCQPGSSAYEVIALLPAHTAPDPTRPGERICTLCGQAQELCVSNPCAPRQALVDARECKR